MENSEDNLFRQLAELLPPPASPVHAHGDWAAIELQCGFKFPSDFKRFTETYGKGIIHPVGIWFVNPFRSPIGLDLIRDQHLRQAGDDFPFTFFPDEGGLFPWGGSNSNHYFFWKSAAGAAIAEIVATLDCCEWASYPNESFLTFLLRLLRQSGSEFNDPVLEPLEVGDEGDFVYEVVS